MVAIMVHIHKHKRVTIHSIQSTYFNDAKFMSIQEEVYPMVYRTPREQQRVNFHLVGPLNSESIYKYNQTQQKVHISEWKSLKQCNNLGIPPPPFAGNYSSKPKS